MIEDYRRKGGCLWAFGEEDALRKIVVLEAKNSFFPNLVLVIGKVSLKLLGGQRTINRILIK